MLVLFIIGYLAFINLYRLSNLAFLHPIRVLQLLGILYTSINFGCLYVIIRKKSDFQKLFAEKNETLDLKDDKKMKDLNRLKLYCRYSAFFVNVKKKWPWVNQMKKVK